MVPGKPVEGDRIYLHVTGGVVAEPVNL